MKYDPDKHHRRSIRLKNYDYASAGMYFVTICLQNRELLFGNVTDDTLELNGAGRMVKTIWEALPERFPTIEMDEFVVMPNHFHGILVIHKAVRIDTENVGVSLVGTPNRASTGTVPTLGEIIGAFKSITTHQYIQGVRQLGWPSFERRLWQRNYWDHIIRNDESLNKIRRYIESNALSWADDKLHPNAPPFYPEG